MSIADEARDSALHFEAVKYAYRQNREGIVVSFVVHPNDIPAELSSSHIGSRYMIALVELGDDEKPKPKKEKMDWRGMTPASQAAIRCADTQFRSFLRSKHGLDAKDKDEAAIAVRKMCGVTSRMELATNHKARTLWFNIDSQYREWAHL
jgi:hypothetical protein